MGRQGFLVCLKRITIVESEKDNNIFFVSINFLISMTDRSHKFDSQAFLIHTDSSDFFIMFTFCRSRRHLKNVLSVCMNSAITSCRLVS